MVLFKAIPGVNVFCPTLTWTDGLSSESTLKNKQMLVFTDKTMYNLNCINLNNYFGGNKYLHFWCFSANRHAIFGKLVIYYNKYLAWHGLQT